GGGGALRRPRVRGSARGAPPPQAPLHRPPPPISLFSSESSRGAAFAHRYPVKAQAKGKHHRGGTAMTEATSHHYIPALGNIYSAVDQYAEPILRIALGAILIPH